MIARRGFSSLVLAVCAAVSLTAFSAAEAQAGTSSALGYGPTKCTNIGNGEVCATGISGSPNGYDAAYNKWAGPTVTARFQLVCANGYTKWDNGSFSISAGQRKSFVFSVGNQGSCKVVMHSGGTAYSSPYVTIP
ncbi:hypothetical protein [Streptomyces sp. NPDC047985]|uniref:hypothetical protein n=1 Tax=unclassified Streptomyces TaxID=2593676 RepID=UPI003438B816